MMKKYRLTAERYVLPTPAGAYYAVSARGNDSARRFLFSLMRVPSSPLLTQEELQRLSGMDTPQEALELLHHVQKLGWIHASRKAREAPPGTLEDSLPGLLATLSGSRKALLADQQGLYLASHGFPHETAEELSALSADLASVQQRHNGLLANNLGMQSAAWAIVNAGGDSQLGFWPLFIGNQRFALVLAGLPCLNQPGFTGLVWTLSKRYHQEDAA